MISNDVVSNMKMSCIKTMPLPLEMTLGKDYTAFAATDLTTIAYTDSAFSLDF